MTDQPVCYLQEGDDPRDHDITDGIVCAHCYDALAEQVSAAADMLESLRAVFAGHEKYPEQASVWWAVEWMLAKLRGQPKPCVPVECPPVELIEVNATVCGLAGCPWCGDD